MKRQGITSTPGFLDSIIIIFIAAALVIFLLWASSRTIGINAFEHLPDWLEKSYNAIWTSAATGAAGIGLAIVKGLKRKAVDPRPNYLLYILIATIVMLILVFILPRAFSRPDQGEAVFDLTIRPHGPTQALVTSGTIRVELGNLSLTEGINNKGEVDFKSISHAFWGQVIRVLPDIPGYQKEYQTITLDKSAIDINLVEVAPPQTVLKGRIIPPPHLKQQVAVFADGEGGEQQIDSYGRFQVVIHKNIGDVVRVNVCVDRRSVYDDYQTIADNWIDIQVHKPGSLCGSEH